MKKKKWNRLFSVLFVMVTVISFLSGCGRKSAEKEDAETNNDLYQNRIAEHPEFKEQSGLLETLKEMEVFPQKWLKENGNQLSNLCVAIRGGK